MSAVLTPALPQLSLGSVISVHEAAVTALRVLGYQAKLRKCRLDANRELDTVAVYLLPGDTRVPWTGGARPAPVDHHYRYDEHDEGTVTLFSGFGEDDVSRFVAKLSAHPHRRLRLVQEDAAPHAEWDPHGCSPHEVRKIEEQLQTLSLLMAYGPDGTLDRRLRRALAP